jgi:Xaa-Pro aminopeptidase
MFDPHPPHATDPRVFAARRRLLAAQSPGPVLLAAGAPQARNFPANTYPFRATSHFLYLVGRSIPHAALLLADGTASLFVPPAASDQALWHGPTRSLEDLRDLLAFDAVRFTGDLPTALNEAGGRTATLPPQDAETAAWLTRVLERPVGAGTGAALVAPEDAQLADAMIAMRLVHDDAALAQLRAAAHITARAHVAGMRAARAAHTELEVLAAMVADLRKMGLVDAYSPIVTVHGEVLHNSRCDNALAAGDLLLADVGGETPEGWAADITRTWPVSGAFSATQRAIYEIVLETQQSAIAAVKPGARYRAIHELASRSLTEGLRAVGIFKGEVDGLLERGAAALFFPHGIGHLLGLDVHDMEDLGDRAGYAPERTRPAGFGERWLRLDRDLVAGMLVTIEPGFYQVPAILNDPVRASALAGDLDRNILARFSDVRGIRIEDDVLCTENGPVVLTGGVPKSLEEVEALVAGAE